MIYVKSEQYQYKSTDWIEIDNTRLALEGTYIREIVTNPIDELGERLDSGDEES